MRSIKMRKSNQLNRVRRLRNNQQRRVLLKKLHSKVLLRRKQFDSVELNESLQEAC